MTRFTFPLFFFMLCSLLAYGQDSGFTGYATSIIKDNSLEYKAYGFKDEAKVEKYDTLTIQPVGSVSKIVIGLALMKASELGWIDLEADINQYLKFKVINPKIGHNQAITLRHLATHTSGIRDHKKFYTQAYAKGAHSPVTLAAFLESYLTKKGSRYSTKNFGKHRAGEAYSYSNIGAALAAYIIESASKMPFDQFTEKYIFQPLGMNHTHWFYDDTKKEMYSQLFDEKDKPLAVYSLATYPDGSLKTNIVDLSKLLQALMNGYRGDSPILSKNSWEVFFAKNFSETTPIQGINPKEPNSGIFIVYTKSGAVGHTGSDPGVSAVLFFNPQTKVGKIFMANEDLIDPNVDSFKEIWGNL